MRSVLWRWGLQEHEAGSVPNTTLGQWFRSLIFPVARVASEKNVIPEYRQAVLCPDLGPHPPVGPCVASHIQMTLRNFEVPEQHKGTQV